MMTLSEKPKVLITGASGFIGSHLVEAALDRNWEVYAGVRATSSKRALQDPKLKFFTVDMDRMEDLKSDLLAFARDNGGFQYVIHNAGITKPKDPEEFYSGNAVFTRDFAIALLDSQPDLKQFVYMSSMAAIGPGDPNTFKPITEAQSAQPITPYGVSKLKAEEMLSEISGLPYIAIRPSAVYGPRDEKFIGTLVGLFKRGIEVRLGPRSQRMSFVHVADLSQVVLDACLTDLRGVTFNISDGGNYSQVQLNKTIKDFLGVRTIPIRIPTGILVGIGYVIFQTMSSLGKQVHLSHYKMRELTAKNWIIDIGHAEQELNFKPKYTLKNGIEQTLKA
jgi:nucleoside-diphosphate-sugar epimerase